MSDLVRRLRRRVMESWPSGTGNLRNATRVMVPEPLCHEAADRIERLEAFVAKVRQESKTAPFVRLVFDNTTEPPTSRTERFVECSRLDEALAELDK